MTQAEIDRSLVEHLATKGMGWHQDGSMWRDEKGYPTISTVAWMSLDDPMGWKYAGMVWERAKKDTETTSYMADYLGELACNDGLPRHKLLWFLEHATPRIVCEAIAKATGFQEPKENVDAN